MTTAANIKTRPNCRKVFRLTTCSLTYCGKTATWKPVFSKAARVFEHTFRTPLSHHGYIEPCACTVQVHDDGRVEVWASNKGPWGLREQMAEDFGVPQEKIKIHIVHVGGDFGAKASLIDVPMAYYLSKATRRPVKLVFDYTDELLGGGHRHPSVLSLRTGVDRTDILPRSKRSSILAAALTVRRKPILK